jgi:hypothetical protein
MKRFLDSSVTSIERYTLTTNDFRWLHCEAWEKEHIAYFARRRGEVTDQIHKPAATSRKNLNYAKIQNYGRWVLTSADSPEQPWAFCEVQRTQSRFSKFFLLVSVDEVDQDRRQMFYDAVSLLVSAIIDASGAGLLHLHAPHQDSLMGMSEYFGIKMTATFSFNEAELLYGQEDPLLSYDSIKVDPGDWWELPIGLKNRPRTSYLKTRAQRAKKTTSACCSRTKYFSRSGFFER